MDPLGRQGVESLNKKKRSTPALPPKSGPELSHRTYD